MRREVREVIADWLILIGALALLSSLFLPWSHQFSRGFEAWFAPTGALRGVPRDPTAWQVYSIADVTLAVLAAFLIWVAMLGGRVRRIVVVIATAIALAFAVHAHGAPPTSGTLLSAPVTDHPSAGRGETVAAIALSVALAGLALSFTAE
jgi:amino acid transporter